MDLCACGFETRGFAPQTVSPLRRISSHGMTQTRTMSCSILARFLFSTTYFHYKNPGFLTETGVSDFPRRREVRYHTAAKAVTAVNKPFLRRIRQNPQSQVHYFLNFQFKQGALQPAAPHSNRVRFPLTDEPLQLVALQMLDGRPVHIEAADQFGNRLAGGNQSVYHGMLYQRDTAFDHRIVKEQVMEMLVDHAAYPGQKL